MSYLKSPVKNRIVHVLSPTMRIEKKEIPWWEFSDSSQETENRSVVIQENDSKNLGLKESKTSPYFSPTKRNSPTPSPIFLQDRSANSSSISNNSCYHSANSSGISNKSTTPLAQPNKSPYFPRNSPQLSRHSSADFDDSFGASLKPMPKVKSHNSSFTLSQELKMSKDSFNLVDSINETVMQAIKKAEKSQIERNQETNNHVNIETSKSNFVSDHPHSNPDSDPHSNPHSDPYSNPDSDPSFIAKSSPITTKIHQETPFSNMMFKRPLSPQKPDTVKRNTRSFSSSTRNLNKHKDHSIILSTQKPLNPSDDFNPLAKSVRALILSAEQEYILELVKEGTSLFYTGSAGTGKSVLLRAIIKVLRGQYEKGEVAVTASTGLAACNIGGVTLHSFAGVGLGQGTVEALIKKVRRNRKALLRWKEVKVLVIDEISMIDGTFLNTLNEIAQKLRKNSRPFGGIQIVVCGDFYQLPPVSKTTAIDGSEVKEEAKFAFESESWAAAIEQTIILKEVFRQKGDQKFIDMLNEMRSGKVCDETNLEFKKLARKLDKVDGIEPAQLFCTRWEVENANNVRLNSLEGTTQLYTAMDSGSLPQEQRQILLNNFLTPSKLFLKKNAQVMCIKNFDETLVNGSLGTVIDFMDRDTYMHYQVMKENPNASVEEIGEKLSKVKSDKSDKDKSEDLVGDGKVENKVESLDDSIFDFLNNVTPPETNSELQDSSLEVVSAYQNNINRKKELLKTLNEKSSKVRYPLVRFLLPDGVNTREVLVEPESWNVEDENMEILAKRVQVPLILAWALSIHKSQGQTLPKVKVDLRRVFENGQAYVALSRAVSRKGLQVLNFDRFKVKTHPKVTGFYNSLVSAEEIKKGQQKLKFRPVGKHMNEVRRR